MRHLASGIVFANVVLAAGTVGAAPNHMESEVEYRANGSVRVGDQEFASREEYHRSALFRDSGARCGSRSRLPDDLIQLIAPADCGRNSTTIKQDYNDGRTLVIPVVFHVIKKTDGTGDIPAARLQSQIDVLNE